MKVSDWLRKNVTDYTPGVGRVFVICGGGPRSGCGRVVPYYRLYGPLARKVGCPYCGQLYFRPAPIPEWRAALWVVWGWISRQGDPRMPMRMVHDRYA